MQVFVDASFQKNTSTEVALKLLQQFQAILQREALQVNEYLAPLLLNLHNYLHFKSR